MKTLLAFSFVAAATAPAALHAQTVSGQAAIADAPIVAPGEWDGCPGIPMQNGKFLMKDRKVLTISKGCEGPAHPYAIVINSTADSVRVYIRQPGEANICNVNTANGNARCVPAGIFDPKPFEKDIPHYTAKQLRPINPQRYSGRESLACMAKAGFTIDQWRALAATPVQVVAYRKCRAGISDTIPQPHTAGTISPTAAPVAPAAASPSVVMPQVNTSSTTH